uniref:Uncharacterized protein n=1 Tax=Pyricularia oryzae (strain P131) TaxID=1143193 RepID=L7JCY3_PYRO1
MSNKLDCQFPVSRCSSVQHVLARLSAGVLIKKASGSYKTLAPVDGSSILNVAPLSPRQQRWELMHFELSICTHQPKALASAALRSSDLECRFDLFCTRAKGT